jgi:hypothetical protein
MLLLKIYNSKLNRIVEGRKDGLEEKFDLESEGSISMDGNYVSNRFQIEVVSE